MKRNLNGSKQKALKGALYFLVYFPKVVDGHTMSWTFFPFYCSFTCFIYKKGPVQFGKYEKNGKKDKALFLQYPKSKLSYENCQMENWS